MSSDEILQAVNFSVRWPRPMLVALDAYCRRTGQRRATAIRDAMVVVLRDAGCWPPDARSAPTLLRGGPDAPR